MFTRSAAIVCLTILMAGCAHHRDVRPAADGRHRVVVRGPDREPLEQSAINQANHYCSQKKQAAAFVEEKGQFTGKNEQDHKNMRQAGKVFDVVTSGYSGGNTLGHTVTGGDAYVVEMRFVCK